MISLLLGDLNFYRITSIRVHINRIIMKLCSCLETCQCLWQYTRDINFPWPVVKNPCSMAVYIYVYPKCRAHHVSFEQPLLCNTRENDTPSYHHPRIPPCFYLHFRFNNFPHRFLLIQWERPIFRVELLFAAGAGAGAGVRGPPIPRLFLFSLY